MTEPNKKKERIKNNLKTVFNAVDGKLMPERYRKLGNFTPEQVTNEFGSWDSALEEANISKKERIIVDIKKSAEEKDNITSKEYSEEGGFTLNEVREIFGSWGEAKSQSGLQKSRKIPIEDIKKDIKRVNNRISTPITLNEYGKHGNYSVGILQTRDITFAELRDELGIEKPKGQPKKKALEAWEKKLNEVKGRYSPSELKSMLDETGFKYSYRQKKYLKEELKESEIVFHEGSDSGKKYYIKGPESESLKQYYQKFLDRIPDDKENWFMELSGTGTSPKSIVAAIRYLTEDKSQQEIAHEENLTEVSLRNAKNKLVKKYNLGTDAGHNVSSDANNKTKEEPRLEEIKKFFDSRDFDVLNSKEKNSLKEINLSKENIKITVLVDYTSGTTTVENFSNSIKLMQSENIDHKILITKNSIDPDLKEIANQEDNIELINFDDFKSFRDINQQSEPKILLKKFFDNTDIDRETKILAKKIAENAGKNNSNLELAASSVYIADNENKNGLTQREISKEFGVTVISLTIAVKNLRDQLNIQELLEQSEELKYNSDKKHSNFENKADFNQTSRKYGNNNSAENREVIKNLESDSEKKVLDFFKDKEKIMSFGEVSAEMELHRTDISNALSSLTEKNFLKQLNYEDDVIDYYKAI